MKLYSIKKHFSSKSLQEEIWALFCLDSIRRLFYQIVEDGMSAGFKLPNKQKLFLHFFSLFSFFFSCFHHSHEWKRIKYLFDISSAHKKYFFLFYFVNWWHFVLVSLEKLEVKCLLKIEGRCFVKIVIHFLIKSKKNFKKIHQKINQISHIQPTQPCLLA